MSKPLVVVAGPVETVSGYGARTRDLCTALVRSNKYEVKIAPLPWGNTPPTALSDDHELKPFILRTNALDRQPDIFIHVTIPNEFRRNGKFNIGITAGIETTTCIPDWVSNCNVMDLVVVSSTHGKLALTNNSHLKLTKPIDVLFEGVDTSVFDKRKVVKSEVSELLKKNVGKSFAFLVVGHWMPGVLGQDRKNIGLTVYTFLKAFARKQKHKQPVLVLKVSEGGFSLPEYENIKQKCIQIRQRVSDELDVPVDKLPRVSLITGKLSRSQLNELYNHPSIKAMISLTKGEGFGRPLLEFATSGKPIIVSDWSGHLDFLSHETATLVPGILTQVHPSTHNKWIPQDAQWFSADANACEEILRTVIKNPGFYEQMCEKSRKLRRQVLDHWCIDKMGEKLIQIIDKHITT